VRDRVFAGRDVAEALASAATALGLPAEALRYVVLDAGSAAGRWLQPTPARVAVLLGELPPAARSGVGGPKDARAAIRETVRSVGEAAGLEIDAEVEEREEAVVIHVGGADPQFFGGPDGRGDVLRALEHLLQRSYGAAFAAPLRVRCPSFREQRDAALAEEAHALAREVRGDGRPRTTEPLNAYERRIVHMALNGEPDVTTYSVGEEGARRVTVAPAAAAPTTPPSAGRPDEPA
jgi:spoIIIJ-associated protein